MGCPCSKGKKAKVRNQKLKDAIEYNFKFCMWVLGAPGAGKTTQCKILETKYNVVRISTGVLLREACVTGHPQAKEIEASIRSAALVDSDIVLEILEHKMTELFDKYNGFLIDGFPRNIKEGERFWNEIASPQLIIFLDCPDDINIESLLLRSQDPKTRRSDDNEEAIKRRLVNFHQISKQVVEYPKWSSRVVRIYANLSQEEVHKEIISEIKKLDEALFDLIN